LFNNLNRILLKIRPPYYHKQTISLICGLIVCLYPLLTAQAQSDTSSKQVNINDVVVTGQYGENALSKSVYKVTVIDQKRIQLQGAFNLKTILTNELNVRIYNDPALGSNLSIQGISGQNIKIMIDGVPMIGREGGNIDLNQINLNNIERIELVEGPMSVSFGTDALGGVINLITKKSKPKTAHIGASAYYESNGQYNAGVTLGASVKKWNVDAGVARNFFEGYSDDPDSRVKQWKPRLQYFGDVAVNKKTANGNIRYTLNIFNEKVTDRDSGTITPYYAYGTDAYLYSQRITNALFWNTTLRKKYPISIVGSYSYYRRIKNTYRKDLVSLDEALIPSDQEQDTNWFNAYMSRGTFTNARQFKKISYQLGYEFNHETAEGKRIRDQFQSISDVNVFGSAEFKLSNRLLIRPGLRLIYNTKYPAPVIPSINMKWDVTSVIAVRASYGRGFRAPSLKELYLDFVDPSHNVQGNEDLKAETQNNYQLSAILQWKEFERIFSIEPAFFYNHINNKIDLALVNASSLEARYVNISDFKSIGNATNILYKAPRYNLTLGYSYTGINNSLMTQSGDYYFSWQLRGNATYQFKKTGITLATFYTYNGKIQNTVYNTQTGDVQSGFIDPYSLWDVSASKSFLKQTLAFTTGVKNILNVKNIAASIPGSVHSTSNNSASMAMGRTVYLSCTYNFTATAK
jgi:outer membrane receptor for ferrienterochelin and colicins